MMSPDGLRMIRRVGRGVALLILGGLGGVIAERTWYAPPREAMLDRMKATIRFHEAIGVGVADSSSQGD